MMSWKFIKNNKIVYIIEKEEKESIWNKIDMLMIEKWEFWLKRRLFFKGLDVFRYVLVDYIINLCFYEML